MKTSIAIRFSVLGTGAKGQKSITDINPNATNAEILAFARAVNALTTNTYIETNKITVVNVDTEEENNG